jgi:hypothetical protein
MKFQLLLIDYAETAWFKRNLFKYQSGVWGVPIWPDYSVLTAAASIGDYHVHVDEAIDRHFDEDDGPCILISETDFSIYEVQVIEALTSTTVDSGDRAKFADRTGGPSFEDRTGLTWDKDVETVESATIVFTAPLTKAWPIGSKIYPLFPATLSKQLTNKALTRVDGETVFEATEHYSERVS